MERQPVTSEAIKSVGYDPDQAILEIEFDGGAVYQYDGVPSGVHEELMNAASHGSYFHDHIRDKYGYRHVGGPIPSSGLWGVPGYPLPKLPPLPPLRRPRKRR